MHVFYVFVNTWLTILTKYWMYSLIFLDYIHLHIQYFLIWNTSIFHFFKFLCHFQQKNFEFWIFAPWENSKIHAKKCPTERKSVLPSANLINRIFRKLYLEYSTLSHSRDTLHLEYPTEKTKLGIIFTDKSHRDTVTDFFQPTTIFQQKLMILCPKPGTHRPDVPFLKNRVWGGSRFE